MNLNHLLHTFWITDTDPLQPVVPASSRGISAASAMRLTWRRASILSSALNAKENCLNHSTSNCGSFMLAWYASILTFGLNREAESFATCRKGQILIWWSSRYHRPELLASLYARGGRETVGWGYWDRWYRDPQHGLRQNRSTQGFSEVRSQFRRHRPSILEPALDLRRW